MWQRFRVEQTPNAPLTFEGRLFSETRFTEDINASAKYAEYQVRFYIHRQGKVVLEAVELGSDPKCSVSLHETLEDAADHLLLVAFVSNPLYDQVLNDLWKRAQRPSHYRD